VLIVAVLVWVWLQIWHIALVLVVAVVMAVALYPTVRGLENRGVARSVASVVVVLTVALAVVAMLAASWVSITSQAQLIVENIRAFHSQLRASFPFLNQLLPAAGQDSIGQYAIAFGRSVMYAVGMCAMGLVLTVYLLIEWERTLEWLLAFVPSRHRQKAGRTLAESRESVYRYVVGNVITSIITSVATFVVLAILQVPAALVLAIVAGLFDFVPVVGFLLSLGLTALLAATVSTTAVLGVLVFYLAFNALENYVIAPKVYGRELELSNLAVLIAVAVGAEVGGVIGALLALPAAATYPIIERIWLRQRLGETVEIHERISA
jgi:predicted PurR-regulated permease PerM